MRDKSSLLRQWTLIRILSARHQGATIEELMRDAGVVERTIRRDLELFREIGFPLTCETGDHGCKRWRIAFDVREAGLGFAFDEALALHLAGRSLTLFAGTCLGDAAQRALQKVRSGFTSKTLDYLEQLRPLWHQTIPKSSGYADKADVLDALLAGLEDRKATFITYQSQQATEPSTRDVYPYGIVHHNGSLYLVAFAPEHQEVRHYKLDRIESAEVSDIHFHPPDGFDLASHLSHSFGIYAGNCDTEVTVRFLPPVVRYVRESRWHTAERFASQEDGSLLANFHVSATEEIKRWIMSFGINAIVESPDSLRAEMLEELNQLTELYRNGYVSSTDGGTARKRTRERT